MHPNVDVPADSESSPDSTLDQHLLDLSISPNSLSSAQLQRLSPVALAYLGDAVYELYVRRFYLTPPKRIQIYHQQVVAQVRAEAQVRHLQTLIPQLTQTEIDWLKRGRNSTTGRSRRVEPEIYQQATSFETLVGYLYLTDPERLFSLLDSLDLTLTENT
ncbi:MAG: ribonuclease III [Oscillatoriales cyanobacterium C42_A2020_001]|nr:ribonuclease III [Leptolyngbyaceae cyanobacterium C42_A2020_001]